MGKVESLMAMSADELAVQRNNQRLAEQQKMAGIQQGIAGVGNVAMGGISHAQAKAGGTSPKITAEDRIKTQAEIDLEEQMRLDNLRG
jgi:hypothetical protein